MLSLRERLAVVNLYEELGSYRVVAALIGCDHKTVKAWLERERHGQSTTRRPRATDAYLPLIRAKLESSQGKIKSKPLHQPDMPRCPDAVRRLESATDFQGTS
jgi:hypothetical protein